MGGGGGGKNFTGFFVERYKPGVNPAGKITKRSQRSDFHSYSIRPNNSIM